MRDFRATWESLSIDIDRLEDHGEQVAVLKAIGQGAARGSTTE
jgi:hypothetical protein